VNRYSYSGPYYSIFDCFWYCWYCRLVCGWQIVGLMQTTSLLQNNLLQSV